jgi:hypothetical protein
MITTIFQGILPFVTIAASLSASYAPSAAIQATDASVVSQSSSYLVREGDTLTSIASAVYGEADYWSVLWNDNDWIENPQVIEPSWNLKIRSTTPTEVEVLKPELQKSLVVATPVTLVASPTPVVAQATEVVTPVIATSPAVLNDAQIAFLGNCESGMTATRNSGNGYYGAFQFSIPTWNAMKTGYERADLAPIEVQIDAVQRLLSRSSIFTQFPGCARKMQSLGMI